MDGHLTLSRRYFDHHFWREERAYSRAEAWLDCVQMACFQPQRKLIGNQVIDVPRGGIVASVRFLSDRWRWSTTKVCSFLEVLRVDAMIVTEKRQGITLLLLCNFDRYNGEKRQESSQESNTRKTRPRQEKDEIEEGEEGKKEKSVSAGAPNTQRRGTAEEISAYCRTLELPETDAEAIFDKWQGNGWRNNGDPIVDWKATIRSWKRHGYLPSQKAAHNGNGHLPTRRDANI